MNNLPSFVTLLKIAQIGQKRAQGSRMYGCLTHRRFKGFKAGFCELFLKKCYIQRFTKKAFKDVKFNLKGGFIGVKWGLNKKSVLVQNGQKSEMEKVWRLI